MYSNLRSDDKKPFNYNEIYTKMKKHQSVWPEALWNEDQTIKYINATLAGERDEEGNIISYLSKLQGSKESQRDWWLYNGFKYRDSKYQTGDATKNYIFLRLYAPGNLYITPYSHIWPSVKYGGNSAIVTVKGKKNNTYELVNPVSAPNNLETWIYSADRISKIGDLSGFKIGDAQFQAATKLQEIILGSDADGYENPNLFNLSVGTNELLTLVNVQNCTNPSFQTIDLSKCHGLETILANGSALTGLTLPNGGHLRRLKLPASFTTLTIQNQKNIEELTLESQENLLFLRIENTPNLPMESLINNSPKLERVRLTNVEWKATNEETLRITMNKLFNCKGFDANGLNQDKPVVTGKIYINSISDEYLEEINDIFPELIVVVNGIAKYFVRYVNYDAEPLYRYIATEGTAAIDPFELGYIEQPVRPDTERAHYTYKGWSELPKEIYRSYSIIARYEGEYLISFHRNELSNPIVSIGNQQWIKEGEGAIEPVAAGLMYRPEKTPTPAYNYIFAGWHPDYTIIDGSVYDFYPVFTEELRSYPVYFKNDDKVVQESRVFYGDVPVMNFDPNTIYKYIGGEPSPYYEFIGWSPDPTQPITGLTEYKAQFAFDGYIEDSWEEIVTNCKTGNIDIYGLGGRKKIEMTIGGVDTVVEMEIVGKNHDNLAEISKDYNNSSTTASLSFLARVLSKTTLWQMNTTRPIWNEDGSEYPFPEETKEPAGYNWGGYGASGMRKKLQNEMFNLLPAILQNNIKPVKKLSDRGRYFPGILNETIDLLWLPSAEELGEYRPATLATSGQGKVYPVYNNEDSRIKQEEGLTRGTTYWTRSSSRDSSHQFRYVDVSGNIGGQGGSSPLHVAFGFCL